MENFNFNFKKDDTESIIVIKAENKKAAKKVLFKLFPHIKENDIK